MKKLILVAAVSALALSVLSGCATTNTVLAHTTTQYAHTPHNKGNTPLQLTHISYKNAQGFDRDAFCANTVLTKGKPLDIHIKLPQPDDPDIFNRYDFIISPKVKATLSTPKGESLPLIDGNNVRDKHLFAHNTMTFAKYYDTNDPLVRDLSLANQEGIYTLTALEDKQVKICLVSSGGGVKHANKIYPATTMPNNQ